MLGAELADLRLEIVELLFHGVIMYPHLWAIFEPGVLTVKKFDEYGQFYIVQNCEYDLGVLHVNASLIDSGSITRHTRVGSITLSREEETQEQESVM